MSDNPAKRLLSVCEAAERQHPAVGSQRAFEIEVMRHALKHIDDLNRSITTLINKVEVGKKNETLKPKGATVSVKLNPKK